MAPLDIDKLAAELNIQHPLVAAMLEHWIRVTRQRLANCLAATSTIKMLQHELAKSQQVKEKYASSKDIHDEEDEGEEGSQEGAD